MNLFNIEKVYDGQKLALSFHTFLVIYLEFKK